MSNHRRLSRHQTERILSAPAGSDPTVGPVLDALRAPARDRELLRENAAVSVFHAARVTPPPITRSDMTTARSAATRAAIATGVIVAVTSGGFALAATGHLPALPDQASDQATDSVAQSRATTAPTLTPTATPTADVTKTKKPKETATSEPVEPSSTSAPSPSLKGMCNAFSAHDKSLHGKALDSTAFTALATAAGGRENIATYCVTLVGEPKVKPATPAKPTPTNKPTTTGQPTAKPTPTNKPTTTGKPTAKPTPTSKPTSAGHGKPATAGKR
ncbi:hypothetical protein [Nocardioides sp.]|uniref:hypothetical protein n=1 Tax=Nocardioides sp. TaxID=35761 RepID=UPI00286E73C4|nr:hypothetical protein [Nocardioides sp.]